MVLLDVCGVSCKYNSVEVLRNVKFSIEPPNFVGLLGPNGSGKTTLIRALSRALKPAVGNVLIGKSDLYSLTAREASRQVAVVPQDSVVTFGFRGLDVVLMGRNPHLGFLETEGARDLAIAEEAMKLTNSWHLADRRIDELSGGERRRVFLARALAQQPQVLLLDEPTLHLDVCHQIEIMGLLKRIGKERGIAILAVLHDFALASRYCDWLILLNEGKVFAIGSISEVLTADNVRSVFRVNVVLRKDEVTGHLIVASYSLLNLPSSG